MLPNSSKRAPSLKDSAPPPSKRHQGNGLRRAPIAVDHIDLDARVMEIMSGVPHLSPEFLFANIIMGVGPLDQKLTFQYWNLVKTYPTLSSELANAWEEKSFKSIRELVILQNPTPIPTEIPIPSHYNENTLKASQKSFEAKFIGDNHVILCNLLDNLFPGSPGYDSAKDPYNNSISIIQSSGMGKSRVVDALATLRLTFPINLRESVGPNSASYPPPDRGVRAFFDQRPPDAHLKIRYSCFLAALFTVGANWIGRITLAELKEQSLAEYWRDFMAESHSPSEVGINRQKFYSKVLQEADEVDCVPSDSLEKVLRECCKELIQVIRHVTCLSSPDHTFDSRVAFIVYFDEVHRLAKEPDFNEGQYRSAFHVLGSVLSSLQSQKQFAIFLSTNSNLTGFVPPSRQHPSLRSFVQYFHGPFTELSFDTFATNAFEDLGQQQGGNVFLHDVCDDNFLAKFGRPMLVFLIIPLFN
ncbi:hypothetical protein H0H81_010560 [Sphagnurus paluster]|uniref:Uncharacterized protein n=1 Tax=Sphagnurus paluster TaxID=117069 RepID=A0A9P7GLW7_9AGAR|nr:hypothetical protein H0H81_010560 [Sphagnurus paluster]